MLGAVLFALLATSLEIALGLLGAPTALVIVVGLALVATGVLFVSWHPLAVAASCGLYLLAVLAGLVAFSLLGLALQAF